MQDSFVFGIASALSSSVSLGVMLIFDRVMVSDCYRGNSRQAWLVSSVLGAAFGLFATAAVWMVISRIPGTSLGSLWLNFLDLFWPAGLLMLVAGAITIQTMAHYFNLFTGSENDAPNETLIAMWLSSSPIFIFIAFLFLSSLDLDVLQGSGIEKTRTSLFFALSIVLAVLCLAGVEYFDSPVSHRSTVRYSEIFKMLTCIVGYTIIISSILRADNVDPIHSASLQPYYWIGYLAGARVLLNPKDRLDFRANWPRLRLFAGIILAVEVVGMLVYFFEYYALGSIDAALVNLVVGGHVLVVFLLALALSRTRRRFEAAGIRRKWVLGVRLVTNRLPNVELKLGSGLRLAAAQAAILLAIYASSR